MIRTTATTLTIRSANNRGNERRATPGREAAHGDVASLLAAKDAENAALRGEIAAVRNENAALLARVTQLEGA